MLHPLVNAFAGAPASGRHEKLVRVAAKTALPVVVSSVPKCSSRGRHHQAETLDARNFQQPLAGDINPQLDDRVLLIINDDRIKGGGVPVIGRRLPSKSADRLELECPSSSSSGVVIGRRSHRMIQQQQQQKQQQQQLYQFQTSSSIQEYPAESNAPHFERQLVDPIRRAKDNKRRILSSRACSPPPDKYQSQSLSSMMDMDIAVDPKYSLRQQGHKNLRLSSVDDSMSHHYSPSNHTSLEPQLLHSKGPMMMTPDDGSPCSSFCSGFIQPADHHCGSHSSCQNIQNISGQDMSCCCQFEQFSCGQACSSALARSLSSCKRALPATTCCNIQQQHQHSLVHHHHDLHPIGSQKRGRPICHANSPSAHRSSSCLERGSQSTRISARNVPPVHPKPLVCKLEYLYAMDQAESSKRRSQPMQHSETDEISEVSQMYDSLAAELKAKLGNPKVAPILLPPKDYDTMSRKQGKLTGIELRRSTNPQLVGPTASRQSSKPMTIKVQPEGHVTGSARSSGRSIERSRSNSSSGLGSISMEPSSLQSSPDSAPKSTSSNEYIQQHTVGSNCYSSRGNNLSSANNNRITTQNQFLKNSLSPSTSPLNRKTNCSPDNCGGSDSGHSGSGLMDSQERKIMLRDTCDYLMTKEPKHEDSAKAKSFDIQARRARQIQAQSQQHGKGIGHYNPSKVSDGVLWNGRVEIPLKVNNDKNGNTYLATKQIIY